MTLQEFLLKLGIEETELSTIKSVMRPNHINILGYDIRLLIGTSWTGEYQIKENHNRKSIDIQLGKPTVEMMMEECK